MILRNLLFEKQKPVDLPVPILAMKVDIKKLCHIFAIFVKSYMTTTFPFTTANSILGISAGFSVKCAEA